MSFPREIGFQPDPAKVVVPFALAASTATIRFSGTVQPGEIDLSGAVAVCVTPSASNLTRYFNADTTKTHTLFGGSDNVILIHSSVASMVISGTDSRVEVEGM